MTSYIMGNSIAGSGPLILQYENGYQGEELYHQTVTWGWIFFPVLCLTIFGFFYLKPPN